MKIHSSIKYKLLILSASIAVPLLLLVGYLIFAIHNYTNAYNSIVNNMTVANSYNLNFKEEMDESLYKIVVGSASFDTVGEDGSLQDPYVLIRELKEEFGSLRTITTDEESRTWLTILLRNLDTLKDRVDDIRMNLESESSYDVNVEMLDNNIYIMTELIQENIQNYLYYQTKSMEHLTQQLNARVHTFTVFCMIMVVILTALVVLMTMVIVSGITKPVEELSAVTNKVAAGDFTVRAKVDTQDELAQLADRVNRMTESLERLVEKIKEDERKMRKADLRLLQEQINPHFLYNTLDTIIWLIEGNSPDKAVNMVVSLSEFFRLVLSKGKEYITIQDEELHIRSYLEIQQVRYRDILEYEIAINPELYRYKILKLTLQPLVENSLYHGIKYKRAKGKILVSGTLEGEEIHLKVSDDGAGMEEEELAKLQRDIQRPCKETESGFGLANVNERIRMNFGNGYGITIHSRKGGGTCVEVVIPAVEM